MGSKEISASSVLIHDRVGSVAGVSSGGAVSRFRYLPYGEPNTSGGSPIGTHFATYDRSDADTYYANQRSYKAGVGRFLSADPYRSGRAMHDPGLWGRYSYVGSDPVNFGDPSGLARCFVTGYGVTLTGDLAGDQVGSREIKANLQCWGDIGVYVQTYDWVVAEEPNTQAKANALAREAERIYKQEIEDAENALILNSAIYGARFRLLARPECSALFGSPTVFGTLGLSAATGLELLHSEGTYRWGGGAIMKGRAGATFPAEGGVVMGIRRRGSVVSIINENQRSITGILYGELVHTILHELGHGLRLLGFKGGEFEDDDESPGANARNNRLISDRCMTPPFSF